MVPKENNNNAYAKFRRINKEYIVEFFKLAEFKGETDPSFF